MGVVCLNVCTLSSVKAWGLGHGDMKRKTMTVRAFENSVHQTVGVIELDVVTGPYQFDDQFECGRYRGIVHFPIGKTLAPFSRALPHKAHLRSTKGSTFVIDDQPVTILADDEEVGSRKVEVVQHVESGLQFLSYQFETVNCIPLVFTGGLASRDCKQP